MRGRFDADVLIEIWEDAMAAPKWDAEWVPVHADLSTHNLLLRDGRLHAVIDYSLFGLADPAVDLEIGWALLIGDSRAEYQEALAYDDDTWRRSRGWAVRSVNGITYYEHTNPGIAARCAHSLDAVIADWLAR